MKLLFQIFILLLLLNPIRGESSGNSLKKLQGINHYNFWLTAGPQLSFSDNFDLLYGAQAGIIFAVNQQHFIQVKGYESYAPTKIWASPETKANRLKKIRNLSLLYGFGRYKTDSFVFIASTGLSFGKASYRGKLLYLVQDPNCTLCWDKPVFEFEDFNYIGLPFNISFMLTSPIIGTSLDFFVNFHKHTDFGMTLNLHLGKIRNRTNK